ncbi:MAG: hypothetical protein ACLQD8_08815 [Thermoplasmata archaeon]
MAIRFVVWLRAIVILLAVEFVLGVWLNRYGTFPTTHNVVRAVMYTGDPVLSAHLALAVVLVVLAFVLAVSAFGAGAPPKFRWFALGGFLAILAAYESGVQFIGSGFQSNADSLAMFAGFAVAMVFYGIAQRYLGRPASVGPGAPPSADPT